jgi:curved DNA-binding protein CbpA
LSNASARTPKQVTDRFNARDVPLSPTERFILSRVDGALDELQIAKITGLPDEVVLASLRKLESLGLIDFDDGHHASTISLAPAKSSDAPTQPRAPQPLDSHIRNLLFAPDEEVVLSENVDLDPETRRIVVETHRTLDRLDHYALLKVEPTVDRKALKRAYYDLASKFHPDRYFRKNLGSYKLRIEAIFDRITVAHDTLTDRERRADYDAYIAEQRRARGIEDLLANAEAEAKRIEERIERDAREQDGLASRSIPAPPPARDGLPSPSIPPGGPTAADAAGRREVLARRLLGGRTVRSSAPPTNGATSNSASATADAMQSLRHRYEERVGRARATLANKYRANAQGSVAAGDWIAAANAFRVALTLLPNDAELAQSAAAAQRQADAILSTTYARQAGYEEKNGQWVDAARSWARVVRACPTDAAAHDRAAHALIKAEGNMHEAARLAQLACTMEPANAAFRVTLANVYLAAGLTLNARRELETAAQFAPHNATIDALFRRIAKREGRHLPGM